MEFLEKQHLKLWWIYIILAVETIMVGSILLVDKGGMSWKELEEIYFLPIIAMVLPYIITYFVSKSKMTLYIDACGVKYRFWPFHRERMISWTKIEKVYMRKYDALGEYGGWGARYRLWFKFSDKAFIFNDKNVGLQLELTNQKKILFSTERADELLLFLINLKRTNTIGAIETDVRER